MKIVEIVDEKRVFSDVVNGRNEGEGNQLF